MNIRNILLSLAIAFGMQTNAQIIDTVMYRHLTDGTLDTLSISKIDSITFGHDTIWGGLGNLLLPGNATCDTQYISVTGCGGLTTLTYNGYTYDLVEIGGQCWFKENIQTTMYRDSTPIDYEYNLVNTTGAYTWFNNNSTAYGPTYGALYNWYAVDNSAGLCPTGWHVPTDCEWMYLEDTLGMSTAEQESIGFRGTDEGGQLKETGTIHWDSPNTGATNSSGFTGLPGGYRFPGGGYNNTIGDVGFWWSSSQIDTSFARQRSLDHDYRTVYRNSSFHKGYGFSVRCLKD